MESLQGLTIFSRVVEAGSFSEASRQLGASPSSVSRQINELEHTLGVQLFHRTTRKLSLTEPGELYYEKVVGILADLNDARLAVTQTGGSPTGVLRVAAPSGLTPRYLVPLISQFQTLFPGISVVLLVSDAIQDMVEQRIDLTLRLGKLDDSSLVARLIANGRRVVCASTEYLRENGTPGAPDDLADHNCLTFRSTAGANLWRFKDHQNRHHDVRASGDLFVNDAATLTAAAVAGHGIVLLPHWLVQEEIEKLRLRQILGEYEVVPATVPLYAMYPRQRYLAPKVRAFLDFLIDVF